MKESEDTRRKLEVLTQFFNKKEAELQKQLGLQTVRCNCELLISNSFETLLNAIYVFCTSNNKNGND
jgi:hypothetical protein